MNIYGLTIIIVSLIIFSTIFGTEEPFRTIWLSIKDVHSALKENDLFYNSAVVIFHLVVLVGVVNWLFKKNKSNDEDDTFEQLREAYERSYKKDVTDDEVSEFMQPILTDLSKYLVKRIPVEPDEQEKCSYKPKPKKRKKAKHGGQAHHGTQANTQSGNQGSNASRGQTGQDNTAQIIEGGIDYLENVYAKPNSSLKARGFELGLSADKRTAIKNDLVRNGFVIEFSVDLGKEFGGRVKMLKLTEKGNKVIGKQMKGPFPNGNESLEHLWWKVHIANDYAQKGHRVNIEKILNNKPADVCVTTRDELVAVEVELTPKNVVYNLKADIDAGFSRVIVACKNTTVKKEAEKQIKVFVKNNPSYEGRYKIYLLKDYPFVKKMMKEVRGE